MRGRKGLLEISSACVARLGTVSLRHHRVTVSSVSGRAARVLRVVQNGVDESGGSLAEWLPWEGGASDTLHLLQTGTAKTLRSPGGSLNYFCNRWSNVVCAGLNAWSSRNPTSLAIGNTTEIRVINNDQSQESEISCEWSSCSCLQDCSAASASLRACSAAAALC